MSVILHEELFCSIMILHLVGLSHNLLCLWSLCPGEQTAFCISSPKCSTYPVSLNRFLKSHLCSHADYIYGCTLTFTLTCEELHGLAHDLCITFIIVWMTPTNCTTSSCLGVLGSRHAFEWWDLLTVLRKGSPNAVFLLQAFPACACSSRRRCRSLGCRAASELLC